MVSAPWLNQKESGNTGTSTGGTTGSDAIPSVALTADGHADRLEVKPGAPFQLSWVSKNAVLCRVTAQLGSSGVAQVQDWGNHLVGTHSTTISSETLFVAVCQNAAGERASALVDVTVSALQPSVLLTANGKTGTLSISPGASVQLDWSSQNAVQCALTMQSPPGGMPEAQTWGNFLSGSHVMNLSSETIFVATCQNSGGATASAQVGITLSATPPPSVSITANGKSGQLSVVSGASVQVDWKSLNATQCEVSAQAGPSGTPQVQSWGSGLLGSHAVALTTETIFTVTCQNAIGASVSSKVDVLIAGPDPSVVLTANGKTGALTVTTGSTVQIGWSSQNAILCTMTAQAGASGSPQPVSWGNFLTGTHSLAMTSETIFVATCQNSAGTSVSSQVDVSVADPLPSVTLTGNGKSGTLTVASASNVQMEWASQNATECSITAQLGAGGTAQVQSWGNTISGAQAVTISSETFFVATCHNANGASASAQLKVEVSATPPTVTITANGTPGQVTVTAGSQVQIDWNSQNATQCSITAQLLPDGTAQAQTWGNGLSGSHSLTLSNETVFIATCQNADGNATTAQVDVAVNFPAPTVMITANGIPGQLAVPWGSSVVIGWASQNATQCTVTAQAGPDGSPQAQSWGHTLTGSQSLSLSSETVFVATCQNAMGVSISSQVDVTVTAALPLVTITANGKTDHLVLTSGNAALIAWQSQNSTQCTVTAQAGPTGVPQVQSWGNLLSGSHSVSPTAETVFIATCKNALGNTATSQVDVYVAPPCNGNGKTIIQLLTAQLVNNAPNQFMQYDLSYQDCNGQPAPIPSGQLWYDDAAYFSNGGQLLPYSVSSSDGSLNASGNLSPVRGEDLFGNRGSRYFHFTTNQNIEVPPNVLSLRVTIDMSNIEIHAYTTDMRNPPALEKIETFLRIGSSEADVAPVMFKNR